jgi:hypothetical protein
VAGVAYRGGMNLEDIEVDFEVEPVERAGGIGFGVRERVTLKGNISEVERVRLQRASRYCPVGQALARGSMVIEDEVQWRSGEVTALPVNAGNLPTLDGNLPVIRPGSVHASYLLDTKEYDGEGKMEHEGEAKVYIITDNATHTSRWTVLAGHSSPGLVPPPFPTAQAAWAASTATTLSSLLPLGDGHDVRDLQVEVGLNMAGGRDLAQGSAAEGRVVHRNAVRRLIVPGNPRSMPIEAVQAALLQDPITNAYRDGGVLLDDQVVIGN